MLFQITRTSLWSEEKPYKNCVPIEITQVDIRTLYSFEDYEKRFRESFMDDGTNHRILENGYIARDVGVNSSWGLEISTLEELMEFKDEVGEDLIIRSSHVDDETPCIEIYNTSRE